MATDRYCTIGEIEGYCDGCERCQCGQRARRDRGATPDWDAKALMYYPCAGPDELVWQWAERLHAAGHYWQELGAALGCSGSTVRRNVRDRRAAAGIAHCGDCKRLLHSADDQPSCAWSWADLQVDADGKPLRGTVCKYKAERSATR